MNKIINTLLVLFSLCSLSGHASIKLGSNRLIYDGDKSDVTLSLKNDDARVFLVQTWMDTKGNPLLTGIKIPFMIAPALFQMEPNSENLIQLVYFGAGLPKDRESLLWLNIKTVPAVSDGEKELNNKMLLAVSNRIKVFYRPEGLQGTSVAAIKNLTWKRDGKQSVAAVNNTPFYVVMNKLMLNNNETVVSIETNNTVVPPFGQKIFRLTAQSPDTITVSWSGINDYSIPSQSYSTEIH
ncbi:fimbrial biogenesis chaperone [Buttiauxella sp. S19-1]|uniref:fimbrial biogenesis chaperone n=1 Tax=Buttiauxella sp. S19-1 TaxID=941430 RepID=UPI001EDB1243|nr:molecular chaperone [Buttiauxella sp. S19-1]